MVRSLTDERQREMVVVSTRVKRRAKSPPCLVMLHEKFERRASLGYPTFMANTSNFLWNITKHADNFACLLTLLLTTTIYLCRSCEYGLFFMRMRPSRQAHKSYRNTSIPVLRKASVVKWRLVGGRR